MRKDTGGEFWDTVFDLVSLTFSVIDVINNPDDPWAWVGLAGDLVDVIVPCVGGVGEVTRAVSKGKRAVDAADTVIDGVKIKKATEFTRDAKKALKQLDRSVGITKSTAAAGKKIHAGYKTGYNKLEGMVKEAKFGRNRMDFLDETNKIIYELKPNNPKSIAQGIRQLKRYDNAMGGGYTLILELY